MNTQQSQIFAFLSILQQMPHHETENPNSIDPLLLSFLGIIIGLLALLILIVVYFFYRASRAIGEEQSSNEEKLKELSSDQKKESPDRISQPIRSRPSQWEILSLEEQAIIDLLIQHEGNILQKDVSYQTEFSKSTVTRILSRLEDQDLVYRSPAGRGYRIFLK
ncbi:MAG: helix-turn-helix transcriptional regulator [Candidatus Hodarchaeales archaeon]|jgi:uncharacterized membrane protein